MRANRPDLGSFEPGVLYLHSATGDIVEFIGVAHRARPEDTEDVGVFRFVMRAAPPLAASRAGYEAGERFDPVRTQDPDAPAEPVTTWRYLAERVDREDIFGLREALAALPMFLRDRFMARWAQLGARCEYDVQLVRADVFREVVDSKESEPELTEAWAIVGAPMSSYLAWRHTKTG